MNNLIARIHTGVSTPVVVVQFSFANRKVVPFGLPWRPNETIAEAANRSDRHTGKQIVKPVSPLYADNLYNLLWQQGYRLVEAWAQERRKGKGVSYYACRFTFWQREEAVFPGEEVFATNVVAFFGLVQSATWRFRAFSNPFYANGEEVPCQWCLSFNLEARQPLVNDNGAGMVMISPALWSGLSIFTLVPEN